MNTGPKDPHPSHARCAVATAGLLLVLASGIAQSTAHAQTFSKTFRGRLEAFDVGVTMQFNRNGGHLSGAVIDESTRQSTTLKGTISRDGRITLYEYYRGKRTGIWKGRLDSPTQFSGSYSPLRREADGSNFVLRSH